MSKHITGLHYFNFFQTDYEQSTETSKYRFSLL